MARAIIAATGYTINSDPKNLVLDSNISSLMIIDEVDVLGTDTEYTHGLGYIPTEFEYFNYDSQWFPIESPVYNTSDTFISESPYLEYDTNKVYFTNPNSYPIKLLISGNAADNQTGSGKNTASGKFKVAKSGLNIPDITDVRQFQFCSGLDTIKKDLSLSGSTTLSYTFGFLKKEITHNLGYYPVVIAHIESNPDSLYNGVGLPTNVADFDFAPVSFYVTTTKIVFFIDGAAASGDYVIKYNLYRNKI